MATQVLNQDPTKDFKGVGILRLAELDSNGLPRGFRKIGDVRDFTIDIATDDIQRKDNQQPGHPVANVVQINPVKTVNFTTTSQSGENLRDFLFGNLREIAAETVTDEQITAYQGGASKLKNINLSTWSSLTNLAKTKTFKRNVGGNADVNVTLDETTDTFAATSHGLNTGDRVKISGALPAEYSAGTIYFVISANANDFQLSATLGGSAIDATTAGSELVVTSVFDYEVDLATGVVDFTEEADISDGDIVLANYASGAYNSAEAFTSTNRYYALLFQGVNEARNYTPVVWELFKVSLKPVANLAGITEDFGEYPVEGTILLDETKPNDGLNSQYFNYQQVA